MTSPDFICDKPVKWSVNVFEFRATEFYSVILRQGQHLLAHFCKLVACKEEAVVAKMIGKTL